MRKIINTFTWTIDVTFAAYAELLTPIESRGGLKTWCPVSWASSCEQRKNPNRAPNAHDGHDSGGNGPLSFSESGSQASLVIHHWSLSPGYSGESEGDVLMALPFKVIPCFRSCQIDQLAWKSYQCFLTHTPGEQVTPDVYLWPPLHARLSNWGWTRRG